MDIPAAAGAWLALGVAIGIALFAMVAALLRRPSSGARPATPADEAADDLTTFAEHPPGFPGERIRPAEGWVALSAPPPPAPPAAPGPSVSRRALVATAVAALLLAGVTAVVAGTADLGDDRRPDRRASSAAPPRGLEARLSFGGLVLERRAVGVTATYPELRIAGGRAQLELPTWNCLADEAPPDPDAAGCLRTPPEYAELAAPGLRVTDTGAGWEIAGEFATETRPNGSGPVSTGRAYQLVVTVAAGDGAERGWRPAVGTLRLGADEAATTGSDVAAGVNVLRSTGG